jgi:hypothetical protein
MDISTTKRVGVGVRSRLRGNTRRESPKDCHPDYKQGDQCQPNRPHITASMPPRLQLLSRAARVFPQQAYQPVAPFLYPFLHQQQRPASILSSLSDTKGAYSHRIRRGRGPSSGKGKTSGRGHKGQKAHGKVPFGFNGGQTPEIVVSGERGEVNQ